MEVLKRKIIIVGAGHVGSHAGYALLSQGLVEEIVYIDIDQKKAEAQALDLYDSTLYLRKGAIVRGRGLLRCQGRPATHRGRRPPAGYEQGTDANGHPAPDH